MAKFELQLRRERRGRFSLNILTALFDELPPEFHDYRIVQLTDMHYGPATALTHLRSAVHIVKELAPQVVLFTGDFVQFTRFGFRHMLSTRVSPKVFRWTNYRRHVRGLAEDLGRALEELTPPDGMFAVFGNHDYHEGIGSIVRKLPQRIVWLTNAQRMIEKGGASLLIAGVDDFKRGKPDLFSALGIGSVKKSIAPGRVTEELFPWRKSAQRPFLRLLMSHNPDIVTAPDHELLRHFDLTICGHTHGGQICLPMWGPIITRTRQKNFFSGLKQPANSSAMYVNHGAGYGAIGIRILCPPEIMLLELKQRS